MNSRQKAILRFMMNAGSKIPFDYYYSEENRNINLIYYYGDKITLKVPSKKGSSSISSLDTACFNANQQITKAVISNGIEAIY